MIEVIVSAQNAGGRLQETLRSVAVQTMPPVRVIVVDDTGEGVAATEAAIVGAGVPDQPPVRVIGNDHSPGRAGARNTGIAHSEAEWLVFLNAGDILAPRHLETLQAVVTAGDAVLGFGDAAVFRDSAEGQRRIEVAHYLDGSGLNRFPARECAPGIWTLGEASFEASLCEGLLVTAACMVKRDAAVAMGGFDHTLTQADDFDFFLSLALKGSFAFTRDVIAEVPAGEAAPDRLAVTRNVARSMARALIGPLPPPIDPRQAQALRAALPLALGKFLDLASLAGSPAFMEAAGLACKCGHSFMPANPKYLFRIMLRRRTRAG